MKKLSVLLLYFVCLHSFATGYLKVLYIADHQTDCGDKKCFLARESPTDTFSVLKYDIQGFSYEAGFEYCLLVNIEKNEFTNTINGKRLTQTNYILSEIKSKTQTGKTSVLKNKAISIPDTSKWMLYKLRMKDGSTRTFSLQKTYLQFDIKSNTVSGNTDCNAFSARFIIDSSSLKFDNIVTTKMACNKRSIEPEFITMLNTATTYKITSKLFYILKGKTLLALFTVKSKKSSVE